MGGSSGETLTAFRGELIQLYTRLWENILALAERHGAEVVLWYSPSRIPQPRFVLGRIALDADSLLNDQEFNPPPTRLWGPSRTSGGVWSPGEETGKA